MRLNPGCLSMFPENMGLVCTLLFSKYCISSNLVKGAFFLMVRGNVIHCVLTFFSCLGRIKVDSYFLKKLLNSLKFLSLVFLNTLSFASCLFPKAAHISFGKKLYPIS